MGDAGSLASHCFRRHDRLGLNGQVGTRRVVAPGEDAVDVGHEIQPGREQLARRDALNRQTALNAPAGTPSVTYAYDNLGRLTSASIPGQTTTQAWDALGRLTSETGPLGSMSYQYDLAGRRTRQTWPDAFFVTNSWNLTGEMTAILQGGTTQIIGFGYDNLGRRTGITRGNGVTSAYGYDRMGRLTSLSHAMSVGRPEARWRLRRPFSGNRSSSVIKTWLRFSVVN